MISRTDHHPSFYVSCMFAVCMRGGKKDRDTRSDPCPVVVSSPWQANYIKDPLNWADLLAVCALPFRFVALVTTSEVWTWERTWGCGVSEDLATGSGKCCVDSGDPQLRMNMEVDNCLAG